MSKKKREHGRDYNGRKKNVNTMISIGPQWIEKEHEYYGEYRTTAGGTYIIMRIIWQYRNASRSLNFILYILFDNVAMYQSYIHVIAEHVVLTCRMSLKKIFYYTNKAVAYQRLHFLLLLVGWTIPYTFLKIRDGGKLRKSSGNVVASVVQMDRYYTLSKHVWFHEILRSKWRIL